MITAQAVEAAAKAFIEHGTLLEALEAAAPHMLAHKVEPVEAIVTKGPWEPIDTAEWWKPHARSCNVFRAPRADCDCGEEIP